MISLDSLPECALQTKVLELRDSCQRPCKRLKLDQHEKDGDAKSTLRQATVPGSSPTTTEDAKEATTPEQHAAAACAPPSKPRSRRRARDPTQPMKNASRERMQAELAYLRDAVADLERTRRTLVEQRRHQSSAMLAPVPRVWENVAREQFSMRVQAEAENEHLKLQLNEKMHIAARLQHELQHRRQVEQETSRVVSLLADDARARFKQLEREVDAAYTDVDAIFDASFATTPQLHDADGRSSLVHKTRCVGGRDQVYVEQRSSLLVPFDYAHTCQAVWKAIDNVQRDRYSSLEYDTKTDNMMALYASSTQQFQGRDMSWSAPIVVKKYVETRSMFIVWRSTVTTGGERDRGVLSWKQPSTTDVTGWVRVQEVDATSGERTAVIHTCFQACPQSGDAADDSSLVMAAAHEDFAAATELMANMLLADALSA